MGDLKRHYMKIVNTVEEILVLYLVIFQDGISQIEFDAQINLIIRIIYMTIK